MVVKRSLDGEILNFFPAAFTIFKSNLILKLEKVSKCALQLMHGKPIDVAFLVTQTIGFIFISEETRMQKK